MQAGVPALCQGSNFVSQKEGGSVFMIILQGAIFSKRNLYMRGWTSAWWIEEEEIPGFEGFWIRVLKHWKVFLTQKLERIIDNL